MPNASTSGEKKQEVSKKYIYIDGAELAAKRRAAGFASRKALANAMKADAKGSKTPEEKTLENYEKSSENDPRRAFRTFIECVMPLIGVSNIEDLTLKSNHRHIEDGGMSGKWDATMLDVEVQGHIEYKDSTRRPAIPILMRLGQSGATLVAIGEMPNESRDNFTFIGQLREAGNRVVGDYTIANTEVPQFGTVMLLRSECGRELSGFYMGRGTVKGAKFVLGTADLRKVGQLSEEDKKELIGVLMQHGCSCGLHRDPAGKDGS